MCSAGVGAAVCDGSSSINRSASDTGVGCCCFLPCPTVSCDCLNLLWLVELWVQRIRVLLLGLWGSTALTEPGPSALCSSSSSLMAGHLDGAFVCTQINGAGEVPSASGGAVRLCPSSWEHSVRMEADPFCQYGWGGGNTARRQRLVTPSTVCSQYLPAVLLTCTVPAKELLLDAVGQRDKNLHGHNSAAARALLCPFAPQSCSQVSRPLSPPLPFFPINQKQRVSSWLPPQELGAALQGVQPPPQHGGLQIF